MNPKQIEDIFTHLRSEFNIPDDITIAFDVHPEVVHDGILGDVVKQSGSNRTASVLTAPFLNRKTEIPQFLDHMIEYEDEDDIGLNSGRRFIISADRIISLTISENPPP